MARFDGKVALITGGASGIGLATAERLASEGAQIVIGDIDEAGGQVAAEKLGGRFLPLDVGDSGAWPAVVESAVSSCGGLDIAFLNAGVSTYPPAENPEELGIMGSFDIAALSDEDYRRIMGINVDGVVFGVRSVTPAMEQRGGGDIIATASVAGIMGFAPDPIYTLTKHAVVGLTRALAGSLAPRNIRVNCICPGVVDTNILGPSMGQFMRDNGIPVMEPSQIADAVALAISSGANGEAYVCLPGRDHQRWEFKPVEGLGLDEGDMLNLGDVPGA